MLSSDEKNFFACCCNIPMAVRPVRFPFALPGYSHPPSNAKYTESYINWLYLKKTTEAKQWHTYIL
jgi:hypothetical protein